MNHDSGYYQGPPGVFYDFKHDHIFELIYHGRQVFNRKLGKIVGRMYVLAFNRTDVKRKTDKTCMTGMDNVIRLGDL